MSVSMADQWNSWFSFYSGKHPSSTLLEANVAAQSEGMAGSMPDDGQSNDDGQSISGASRLSAATTTSHRASFADQQQQPLEQMCAPIVPSHHPTCLIWPGTVWATFSHRRPLTGPNPTPAYPTHPPDYPLSLPADFLSLRATIWRAMSSRL